ncbi:MAG: LysM peptidoglycan-binding domain-containing protein [Pseudomonadota bacterium]
MVAIVAGNGLGLFNTSLNTLGGAGVTGQEVGLGQAGGGAFVNAATGNLILQFNDEQLSGLGQDLYHLRTYNAQGVIADDDADGWRWQGERKVVLTGTRNTAGSTVTRTTGDGHQTVYAWDGTAYTSSEGDGAHDSLSWSAGISRWVWTDGSTRTVEQYLETTGRLASVTDAEGTSITYSYNTNGRLSSIKDSAGQELVLNYNAAGKLERLDTRTTSGGALTRQVYYAYDGNNRLKTVSTDLTPTDGSITDGKVYSTTYAYVGISLRIASISQSDGTSVAYTYQAIRGEYRVTSVADASGTSTFTYDITNRRTDVTNGLGQQWSYFYDAASQLTQVLTPAVEGQRLSTRYTYDTAGNVTRITDGRSNAVTYEYDGNGNRVLERDALGNTLTRVFSATHQRLNETRYTTPASFSDGVWTDPPAVNASTKRSVYDASNRLRFTVDETGMVTEQRYNASGLRNQVISYNDSAYSLEGLLPPDTIFEAQLNAWVAARDKTHSQLTEMVYDYRGNLSKTTTYATVNSAGAGVLDAAASVTERVYSESGQLLQTIAVRGALRTTKTTLSSVAYDGQGRVLSQVDANGTQTSVYNGTTRQITVTNSAGLSTVQTFDTRGRLVSVSATGSDGYTANTTRTSQIVYDAHGRLTMTQDTTGVRTYTFYDEAGRVSARVDGTGAVVEYRYNEAGQLAQEKRYANLATTTSWYNGTVVTKTLVSEIRPTSSALDRVLAYAYDAAGRLSTSTNEVGLVTTSTYDARGLLMQTQAGDRVVRYFYDAAGRQLGQLDAEGYLRENRYSAGGQLVRVTRYEMATSPEWRASGTLDQLRPSTGNNLSTWYYYDDAGRQIGSVDEQQFVTETVFDDALNTLQSTRYAVAHTAAITSTTPFAAIKAAVASSAQQTTLVAYDSIGRVSQRTGADGVITTFEYDVAGRLVKETQAQGSPEERSQRLRYDAFDQVIGKLLGEASARVTASTTATQLATIYAQYGLAYRYDAAGRAVSITDANGNKTVSYYDEAGRLTHVVNALGEVSETVYSAFGEANERTQLLARLSNPASLTGGLNTPIKPLVQAIKNAANDNKTVYEYNALGLLTAQTDAMGWLTSMVYNSFGERTGLTRTLSAGTTTTQGFTYSKRGELLSSTEDVGGLNRTTGSQYDAFGRVVSTTDGRGFVSSTRYDLNGRKIVTQDPLNPSRSTEYDAWGRTYQETDALGHVTTYAYDDTARQLTVTYPDGAGVTTERNRHGEVFKVTDGRGYTTTYTYTKDGLLDTVVDALAQTSTDNTYDEAGNRISSKNALNQLTAFTYDAANRVVTRTDANGVITQYRFDGMGRKTDVIEARNLTEQRTTTYAYDRKGQVLSVTQDAGGLNLTTRYQYDGRGQQVLVTRGTTAQPELQATRYTYDALGRRISEQVDPNGLNLTTQYRYNSHDQVTRKTDALGNSTWYVHDAAGRLTDTVDALGGVTRNAYDAAGQMTSTTRYFAALPATTLSAFGDVVTDVIPMATTTRDQVTTYGYDNTGRLSWTQDNATNLKDAYSYDLAGNRKTLTNKAGAVWTYTYDALGRLTEEVTPAVTVQNSADAASVSRKLVTQIGYDAAGNVISRTEGILRDPAGSAADDISQARVTAYAYDGVGRQIRTTQAGWYNKTTGQYQQSSGAGSTTFQTTTEVTYDALGNAVRNRIKVNNTGTASTDFVDSYKVYDAAGRARYEIDALGGVVENGYDALNQVISLKRYANGISSGVPSGSTYYNMADMPSRLTADAANDRTLTLTYDAAGRKTAVQQNLVSTYTYAGDVLQAAPTTVYSWNALGQMVRETLIGRAANSTTVITGASTVHYYDALGRRSGSVDALGYYTRFEYNALGQLARQVEYASALTSWAEGSVPTLPTAHANDRSTAYAYDQLGRAVQVTQESVRYYTQTGTATIGGNLGANVVASGNVAVSKTTYDSLGNVKTQTDALGNVTSTDYDVLGRVIQIKEPARATAGTGAVDPFAVTQVTASPVTTMALNAFGQVVKQTRSAGSDGANTQAGLTQISKSTYDAAGYEVQNIDASGATINYRIDAQGRRLEESQLVSASWSELKDANGNGYADDTAAQKGYSHTIRRSFEYDKLGQQLATSDWYLSSTNVSQRTRTSQAFNRFGEATGQYLNDKLISGFTYDQAGRKTQQTGSQGIVNMAYDIAGQLTRSTQAGDTTTTADDRVTTMTYDLLGRVQVQRLPKFLANTQTNSLLLPTGAVDFDPNTSLWLTNTTPTITLTYDRWGNTTSQTDARGKITTYTYDHGNRALTETLPETDIVRENGTSYRASLIHERRYDALGRLIQEVDLIGPYTGVSTATELRKRQHTYNAVGQLTTDVDAIFTQTNGADGNVRSYAVDMNGNRVGTKDILGTVLVDSYDAMGRQLTHGILRGGAQTVLQTNLYDQAGRLYAEISGTTAVEETLRSVAATVSPWDSTTSGVAGNTRYTVFDERGNIVRTRNESKVEKFYGFDANNRKTLELDGLGNTLIWQYKEDVGYEQLASRKDLGGRLYGLEYNLFGQVSAEQLAVAGAEVARTYSYYGNGQIQRITDTKITSGSTSSIHYRNIDERSSEYQYDASGNRVRAIDGSLVYKENTYKSNGSVTLSPYRKDATETRYRFDEQNRLIGLYVPNNGRLAAGFPDAAGAYKEYEGARVDEMKYRYDEFGNRRQVFLNTVTIGGTPTQLDYWYAYDANDRVRVTDGYINAEGKVVAGLSSGKIKGTALTYDRVGRRSSAEQWSGEIYDAYHDAVVGNKFAEEVYQYNDMGQVTAIRERSTTRVGTDTSQAKVNIEYDDGYGGTAIAYAEGSQADKLLNTYDARGNKTAEIENDAAGVQKTRTDYRYRGDGQAHEQTTYKYNTKYKVYDKLQVTYLNEVGMLDAAGLQTNYRYVVFKTSKYGVTSYSYRGNYVKTYAAFDSYKETTTVATWINKSGTAGTSTLTYNDRGDLQQVQLTGGTKYTRYYALNREGQVVMRHQADKDNTDSYLYHNGAALVLLGRPHKPELMDTYTPISSSYPASTPTSYVVNEGDTLEGIAQMVWGDAQMWYLIADANGLEGTDPLVLGDTLTIPNVVSSTHNDSKTFKPYNPAEAIGNTTPSPKPPEPKCNAVATIVMIVVAVAASFLAGPLGQMLSSQFLGGAAAAMIGSAASQLAGKAMGVVDSFSLRQVIASGITGGIAAGVQGALAATASSVNAVNGASQFATMTNGVAKLTALGQGVQGISSVAASYLANKVTGQNTSFSWAGVAAGFVGGYIQGKVGFGQSLEVKTGVPAINNLSNSFTQAMVRRTVSSSVERLFGVAGKQDWGMVAADAFGNALGNHLVDNMKPAAAELRLKQVLADALKELDVVKENAKMVAAALSDPQKQALLRDKGFDPVKLRATYVADLASGDVYLDYKSTSVGNDEKIARMKEALGYFGVSRLSDEQLTVLKLDPDKFVNEKSGYYAALYKDDVNGGYLLANRGTESLRDLRTDLVNNFAGVDAQFEDATKLARIVSSREAVGKNVTFTGHSLGGGLASAQAAAVSGIAITFNAAGLTQRVADKLSLDLSNNNLAKVEANYLQGDLVSRLQDNPLIDGLAAVLGSPVKYGIQAIGLLTGQVRSSELNLTIGYAPEAFGTRHMILPANNDWSPLTRHLNNSILQSLTDQYLSMATEEGRH